MKTTSEHFLTSLIALAVVLGVLCYTEATAGETYADTDRRSVLQSAGDGVDSYEETINALDLIPEEWSVDRELTSEKGPNDLLRVTVTGARWDGQYYIAFLLVEWGNLNNVSGHVPPGGVSDWGGSVAVDDGHVIAVAKIGFETPELTREEQLQFAKYRVELDDDLIDASLKREWAIAAAYDDISEAGQLSSALERIDAQFEESIAKAHQEFRTKAAALLADGAEDTPQDDVLLVSDEPDTIEWKANVTGGRDGLLLKLVLEKDDSGISVEAGGEEIEFQTMPQSPQAVVLPATRLVYSANKSGRNSVRYYSADSSRNHVTYRDTTYHVDYGYPYYGIYGYYYTPVVVHYSVCAASVRPRAAVKRGGTSNQRDHGTVRHVAVPGGHERVVTPGRPVYRPRTTSSTARDRASSSVSVRIGSTPTRGAALRTSSRATIRSRSSGSSSSGSVSRVTTRRAYPSRATAIQRSSPRTGGSPMRNVATMQAGARMVRSGGGSGGRR